MKTLPAAVAVLLTLAAPADAKDKPLPRPEPPRKSTECAYLGPGYVKAPGSDTCIKIGGYVRAQGSFAR